MHTHHIMPGSQHSTYITPHFLWFLTFPHLFCNIPECWREPCRCPIYGCLFNGHLLFEQIWTSVKGSFSDWSCQQHLSMGKNYNYLEGNVMRISCPLSQTTAVVSIWGPVTSLAMDFWLQRTLTNANFLLWSRSWLQSKGNWLLL